jgi:hypothetical protein
MLESNASRASPHVPFRMRKSAAVLCIAIAVFATIVSAIDDMAPVLVLAAAWQVVPLPASVVIRREDAPCDEQTASLLAIALSRPPPRSVVAA